MKDIDIRNLLGRDAIQLKSDHIDRYIKDKVILITGGGGSKQAQCKPFARPPGGCEQNVNNWLKACENGTFDGKE